MSASGLSMAREFQNMDLQSGKHVLVAEVEMKCGELIVPAHRDITMPLLHDW